MKYVIILILFIISCAGKCFSAEELYLELVYQNIPINYSLGVLKSDGEVFVSIEDFFLESGLIFKNEGSKIKIMNLDLETIVSIDTKLLTVKSSYADEKFNAKDIIELDSRYYFSNHFIKNSLKIDVSFNIEDMKARYSDSSIFKTPIVKKIDRKSNRVFGEIKEKKKGENQSFSPSVFSSPRSSHTFAFSDRDGTKQNISNHTLTNEILGFEQQYGFGINNKGEIEERGKFARRFDENGLFPGFDATEIQLFNGDFITNSLVETKSGSSDIFISNRLTSTQNGEWDTRDFRGVLEQGWEVELFVNKKLIGVSTGKDGMYIFKKVSLEKGLNEVELVFLGPNGEIRKEKEFLNIGGNTVFKDRIYYDFAFNEINKEQSEYVLNTNIPIGTASSIGYSINNSHSSEKEDLFNTLRFNSSSGAVDYSFGIVDSLNTGEAYTANSRINFDNFFTSFALSLKNNYLDYNNSTSYSTRFGNRKGDYTWSSSFNRTESENESSDSYSFFINKKIHDTNINYSLNFTEGLKKHNINLIRRISDFAFSSTLSSIEEEFEFLQISASRMLYDYGINFSTKRDFLREQDESVLSLSYTGRMFNKSLAYKVTDRAGEQNKELSLSLSFGFGDIFNPKTITSKPREGGIKIVAFLDLNNNGIFDKEEELVEGVFFVINGKDVSTNKKGEVFIDGLSSELSYFLEFSDQNIDYISNTENYSVTPHTSSYKEIYFPVTKSFELEGRLECEKKCDGLIISIKSKNGNYKGVTYTTNGGFFYKDSLPMGDYQLQVVDSDEFEKLNIRNRTESLLDSLTIKKIGK